MTYHKETVFMVMNKSTHWLVNSDSPWTMFHGSPEHGPAYGNACVEYTDSDSLTISLSDDAILQLTYAVCMTGQLMNNYNDHICY